VRGLDWLPLHRVVVRGPSMAPTLRDGDVVLARAGGPIRAGDVVLVRWPSRPHQLSVKRALRQADDGWFVQGDNTFSPRDDYQLDAATVVGVVVFRLYPRPGRIR
jgi:phage repressor protein C with HTH and peptisase S24 domain